MVRKRVTLIFLLALMLFALYLCYLIFRPFIWPLMSAAVIGVVFFPVHARMHTLVRSPSLSALLSTILVSLVIIIPVSMIVLAITKEITDLYNFLGERSDESGGYYSYVMQVMERPLQWLGRYVDLSQFDLRATLLSRLQDASRFLLGGFGSIVGNITSFIINSVITLFTLFFLFREGKSMRRRAAAVLPLTSEQVEKLFTGIENTIIATVYGGLVVAAVQGAMIGLALWVLGVPSPVLWGVIASVFALLPLVGTAAVWVPATLYLLFTGSYVKALLLVVWGALIVGSVDNILRPYLISGRVRMHTLLIFFAVFGGVQVFGFLGLFIGPVIMAVTITVLGLLRDEVRGWQSFWQQSQPEQVTPAPDTQV